MRRSAVAALVLLGAATAHAKDMPFNADWLFQRDVARLDWSAAERVALPHTARVEPRIVNDQWQGDAWYGKRFAAPEDWRGQTVMLRIEAAMNVADVWINDVPVARHLGGYLPFTVDLTPHLRLGATNEIRIRLDNRDNAVTGPKPLAELDFNTYGGLYRGVRLIVKPPVHLTDEMLADRVAGGGLFVTYPAVSAEAATVALAADVVNRGADDARATIVYRLYDGEQLVAQSRSHRMIAPGATVGDRQQLEVAPPRLWSPASAALYRLVTRIEDGEGRVDETETRIGLRTLAISADGFRINGERMTLRGVNRHQEYPSVGYALSPEAELRDARLIKAAGFDYVRLSHYPHSPHFMAAADEVGLVVIDAIPGWQFISPDPAFRAQVVRTCRDMIRRDRNHPSVIAWECSLNETAMPVDLVREFDQVVAQEYPGDQAWSAGWQDDGYDIFLQARQHRLQHYTPTTRPYVVSEYGDWEYYAQNAGFQQDRWSDLKPEARTSRQPLGAGEARLLQQATNVQEAHDDNLSTPAFADGYWAMFDYNRGYADDLEHSGVMSLERLPKYAYWFFRSQRGPDEPQGAMVKIASDWTPRSTPLVRVFSNADEVELLLNGRSLGRRRPERGPLSQRIAHPPVTFDVGGFAPGRLEAVGYRGGDPVARDVVETAGAPAALCTVVDTAGVPVGARDLVFLRAHILDGDGRIVRTSAATVTFGVADGWSIVGEPSNRAEAGNASALARAPDVPGQAPSVRVVSHGLTDRGACASDERTLP